MSKRISCPIHGSIELESIEVEVINSQVFQRLRNIQHLGVASLVFPSANYTRFAHSIGVCHTTGRFLNSINSYTHNSRPPKADEKLYRLAGLLHDIGHFPFSHPFEKAIEDVAATENLEDSSKEKDPNGVETDVDIISHEHASKLVIQHSPELRSIWERYEIDPANISAIIEKNGKYPHACIISSDLDADRLDYMQRTAHHTGIPYGAIDFEYLLSQIRIDKDNKLAFTTRAIRTIEHFLLSRYFEYQQVIYHKSVVGFEMLLRKVCARIVEENFSQCLRESDLTSFIADKGWNLFDDISLSNHLRLRAMNSDEIGRLARMLIFRKPPKMVHESKQLLDKDISTTKEPKFQVLLDDARRKFKDLELIVCEQKPKRLLSTQRDSDQAHEDIVRVMVDEMAKTSKPIYEFEDSILKPIKDQQLVVQRVFAISLNEEPISKDRFNEVKAALQDH